MKLFWENRFLLKKGSWVYVPSAESRIIGSEIHEYLMTKWAKPVYYYHLQKGGHVRAAKRHLKNEYFIVLDIKQFYNCINRSRITRILKEFYSYSKAREFANKSVVRKPDTSLNEYVLPYGYIQSPIIASICLNRSRLGKYLEVLSRKNGLSVSVYVDDIIISGNDLDVLKDIYKVIVGLAEKSGFPFHPVQCCMPSTRINVFNLTIGKYYCKIQYIRYRQLLKDYQNATHINIRKGIYKYVEYVNYKQLANLHQIQNGTLRVS